MRGNRTCAGTGNISNQLAQAGFVVDYVEVRQT